MQSERGCRILLHMPKLNGTVQIAKAWRHTGETGKIHYIVTTHDEGERHLIERDGTALYRLLEAALLAQGYTGPKSAEEH